LQAGLEVILNKKVWVSKAIKFMKDFTTYLSTAPVVSLAWLVLTAVLLIGFNKIFPDPLVFTF
jgi:hypothetical protein